MSAPNSQTYKTRDGKDYTLRAVKYPKPEEAKSEVDRFVYTAAHEIYYFADGIFANGQAFDAAEYDRIIYAVSLCRSSAAFAHLRDVVKTADYTKVKQFLDSFGIAPEPPQDHSVPESQASSAAQSEPLVEEVESDNDTMDTDEPTKPKKKHSRLRKKDYVIDEAEEAEEDEDNIDSEPEDSESVYEDIRAREKKDREKHKRKPDAEERDNKILALVSRIEDKPYFKKLKGSCCEVEGCTTKKTPWYDDGLCGTHRKQKKDKAKRKRTAEVKALQKQRDQKSKEAYERSVLIREKKKVQKELKDFDDALGSDSDSDDPSSDDED